MTMSKAERIRKYMEKHETATPSQVESALSQYGITAGYVSLTLYKEKQKKLLREGKKANGGAPPDAQLSYQVVLLCMQLIQQTGSPQQACDAIRVASELKSLLTPSAP